MFETNMENYLLSNKCAHRLPVCVRVCDIIAAHQNEPIEVRRCDQNRTTAKVSQHAAAKEVWWCYDLFSFFWLDDIMFIHDDRDTH